MPAPRPCRPPAQPRARYPRSRVSEHTGPPVPGALLGPRPARTAARRRYPHLHALGDWPVLSLTEAQETTGCAPPLDADRRQGPPRLEPMVNHWWQVPLYVRPGGSPRRSCTPAGSVCEIEFDFIDHHLDLRTTDGGRGQVRSNPRSVADFYRRPWRRWTSSACTVRIYARPRRDARGHPFPEDTRPGPTTPPRCTSSGWPSSRCSGSCSTSGALPGKVSPVHFFWGGARPRGDTVLRPSGAPHAAASPTVRTGCSRWRTATRSAAAATGRAAPTRARSTRTPTRTPGLRRAVGQPAAAAYDAELGEFVLPYTAVREAADPDATCWRSSRPPTRRPPSSPAGTASPWRSGRSRRWATPRPPRRT